MSGYWADDIKVTTLGEVRPSTVGRYIHLLIT